MESNKNSKKIVILGIILLIIAGIIVVSLKGFNVALMFGKHETIEMKLGKEVDMNIVREICDEVFSDKKYIAKELEVFGDSFQINVESITDEEKDNLISKINEKFQTEKTAEDLNIVEVSNKRIRDVVTPYFVPVIISFVLIYIYIAIRFRKVNSLKLIKDSILKIILINAIYFSIIAITRITVNDEIINVSGIISYAIVTFYVIKGEQQLEKLIEK